MNDSAVVMKNQVNLKVKFLWKSIFLVGFFVLGVFFGWVGGGTEQKSKQTPTTTTPKPQQNKKATFSSTVQ